MKPYCSSIIITSVLRGKIAKSNLEPSNGGKGIRLKKARITFQKITSIESSKNIEPTDPEIMPETALQSLKLLIIATLTELGIVIMRAISAKTSAIKMFDPGPPSATNTGPHF